MDDGTIKYLECGFWDSIRGVIKFEIDTLIDHNGEIWHIGHPPIAPCGCEAQADSSPHRSFLWCEKHAGLGVLTYDYKESKWYWLPEKLEVKK